MQDAQLWQQLRSGHKPALERIYRREVDALYRYGRRLTENVPLVEDAIQELFIELWKRRESLGATDAIRPYLLVSLRRKIMRLSQKRDQQTLSWEEDQPPEAETEAAESQLIAEEQTAETQQRLQQALQQLSPRQREILYLKYFQGLDYKDIAEAIGINYQSVRNTASAGLKALRKVLQSWPLLWWMLIFCTLL
ncbi:MAG: sigma-70 family RNA polymerase sigma factor [Bacteroidetes bacterium]|jgi:RNA polymerase sigma-70 factor (ECF subfamily)|nr:sigma-70 family RNA polymerase sigma factor [Bacteroidota bacterium]